MSSTRLGLVAGLAAATALLAGCGSANPGVAAQVGDDEITVRQVDDLTSDYCEAVEGQLEGNNETVPNRYLRGGILGSLALRSAAEQLAAEYDVEPGKTYDQKVAQLEQSVAALPEEVRESVIEVETSSAYVEAVQAAVGKVLLEQEGAEDTEYSATVDRGKRAFQDWIAEHEVDFDPQFGIELAEGDIASVDTSLSYAVSDGATKGAAEQPDAAYSRGLSANQRCG